MSPRSGYAVDAVVFDLLYTLAIPGTYPGGADRIGWLSGLLGIDERELRLRWEAFEPRLETGSVRHRRDVPHPRSTGSLLWRPAWEVPAPTTFWT